MEREPVLAGSTGPILGAALKHVYSIPLFLDPGYEQIFWMHE
jgi:hypothetical protein